MGARAGATASSTSSSIDVTMFLSPNMQVEHMLQLQDLASFRCFPLLWWEVSNSPILIFVLPCDSQISFNLLVDVNVHALPFALHYLLTLKCIALFEMTI
jgi:hypothetical protein